MKGAFGNESVLLFFRLQRLPQYYDCFRRMIRRFPVTMALFIGLAITLVALCLLGIWIPNQPSRVTYSIRGIDISHHQREIQWALVQPSEIHFVYVKATEGANFKDDRFSENWTGAGARGILRGAYHFFILGTSGRLQAVNFIATVPAEPNALPPAIDLEFSGYNRNLRPSSEEFQRELAAFWDAVAAHYGKPPVVYTTADFLKQYLAEMPLERLWIREVISRPREPWMLWQYSARGTVPGISTFVDLNVFNGKETNFKRLLQTGGH
ncbi:MAG: lysozyme [Verrucomicrobiota bacterium]